MKNKTFKLSFRIWFSELIRLEQKSSRNISWNIKQKWLGNTGLSNARRIKIHTRIHIPRISLWKHVQYLLFLVPIVSLNASHFSIEKSNSRNTRGSSLSRYNFLRPAIIPNSMVWQALIFLWHPFDLLCIDKRWILARAFVTNANSMLLRTRFRGRGCRGSLIFPLEFVEFKWSKYRLKGKGFSRIVIRWSYLYFWKCLVYLVNNLRIRINLYNLSCASIVTNLFHLIFISFFLNIINILMFNLFKEWIKLAFL